MNAEKNRLNKSWLWYYLLLHTRTFPLLQHLLQYNNQSTKSKSSPCASLHQTCVSTHILAIWYFFNIVFLDTCLHYLFRTYLVEFLLFGIGRSNFRNADRADRAGCDKPDVFTTQKTAAKTAAVLEYR